MCYNNYRGDNMLDEYSCGDIYIRHAVDDAPDAGSFTMHIHDGCEIYFFVSGNVEYLVEGSRYPLHENSLMIMRPAEAHTPKITAGSTYERYAVNFPLSFADALDPERRLTRAFTERPLGSNNMFSSSDIDTALIKRLFSEMCSCDDDYGKRLTLCTHLIMLLDMIDRAWSERRRSGHKTQSTAERLVMYVNEHLTEDISVAKLAEHFYLSTSQFDRVFKQATGAAPWEYVIKKRLTMAKELLRNGASARQAAESCGFRDYSVFYRAYIRYFGSSPKHSQIKQIGPDTVTE